MNHFMHFRCSRLYSPFPDSKDSVVPSDLYPVIGKLIALLSLPDRLLNLLLGALLGVVVSMPDPKEI